MITQQENLIIQGQFDINLSDQSIKISYQQLITKKKRRRI